MSEYDGMDAIEATAAGETAEARMQRLSVMLPIRLEIPETRPGAWSRYTPIVTARDAVREARQAAEARADAAEAALAAILPTIEYAALQAAYTFDPLIRDGHAGGKREHAKMVEAGIAGTPSALTLKLRAAVAAARAVLDAKGTE